MAAKATTKKRSAAKAEGQPEVQRYFEAMIENQRVLNDAIECARQRSVRMSEQIAKQMAEGRIEALELARQLADDPAAISENWQTLMEASSNAQSRAIDFLKDLYREQAEGGDELRKTVSTLTENSREAATAAMELTRSWATANPMVEAVQRTMEAARS